MGGGAATGEQGPTLPDLVPPMLPAAGELGDATDPGRWAVEFGWEGHRCVAYVRPGRVRLLSSTARSVTRSFPELAVLGEQSPPGGMVLDGTVVALDEAGRPSRGPLLRRTATVAPDDGLRAEVPVGYVVTDLLWRDGRRVLELPYRRRRAELEALGLAGPTILVPPSFGLDEADLVVRTAEQYGLDGLHLKRLDVPYQPGRRTRNWLRVPLRRRRQVQVAGWVPAGSTAGRERIAAVLLALPGADGPVYVGRVGIGAADGDARTVLGARPGRPPADVPEGIAADARWLAPGLVAAVEHRGRTAAGRLALPSWRGLVPPDAQDDDLRDPAPARREPPGGGGATVPVRTAAAPPPPRPPPRRPLRPPRRPSGSGSARPSRRRPRPRRPRAPGTDRCRGGSNSTSSTTPSTRSPRSSGPTRPAPGSCCSGSPTCPGRRTGPRSRRSGSTRSSPRSGRTCRSSGPGSVPGWSRTSTTRGRRAWTRPRPSRRWRCSPPSGAGCRRRSSPPPPGGRCTCVSSRAPAGWRSGRRTGRASPAVPPAPRSSSSACRWTHPPSNARVTG
nr:hypothetical protein [Pseudonocardia sp. EC080625-04]